MSNDMKLGLLILVILFLIVIINDIVYRNKKNKVDKMDYIHDAVEVLGDKSLVIAMEECSELQKELSKYIRGRGNYNNLCEEIADVHVTLEWIYEKLHVDPKDVQKWKEEKINRIEKELKNCTLG